MFNHFYHRGTETQRKSNYFDLRKNILTPEARRAQRKIIDNFQYLILNYELFFSVPLCLCGEKVS